MCPGIRSQYSAKFETAMQKQRSGSILNYLSEYLNNNVKHNNLLILLHNNIHDKGSTERGLEHSHLVDSRAL